MTTINPMSTVGTTAIVLPSDLNDAWTYVAGAGHYKTADLLAALNAVPAEEAAADAESLAEVKAERDALAATIGRVREAFTDLEEGEYDSADCIDAIRAALDPKPAFVLPTEEGGRFEAIDNCGKLSVFRAVADGPDTTYVNTRTWVIWNADIVMSYATDHRLLDGAE